MLAVPDEVEKGYVSVYPGRTALVITGKCSAQSIGRYPGIGIEVTHRVR